MIQEHVLAALRITYEAMGQPVTDMALAAFVSDLADYPEAGILASLSRCRRELRKLTLADVLDRLPGGHPGPEEAWAIVSLGMASEGATLVWTDEMAESYGLVRGLRDDPIAARKAFQECYVAAVGRARVHGKPPKWCPSLGHDKSGRDTPILDAVRLGRLLPDHAHRLMTLPDLSREEAKALLQRLAPPPDRPALPPPTSGPEPPSLP